MTKGRRNRNRFLGRGGTRRGGGAGSMPEQVAMFDIPDDEPESMAELGELARDVNRMTLETSSNLYAQRRAYW